MGFIQYSEFENKDIETVVTREQLEQMEYKVNG